MKHSWMNLEHYIRNHEYNYGLGKKYNYTPKRSFNAEQKDSDFVIRAIFYGDIRPLREHKTDYPNIAEFYIHRKLLKLQRELIRYDASYQYVREWAAKRYYNTLNDINQIRQRYWYYKPLSF